MRILVIGAGATGGYFGGRLLEAGRDVTFLVRARRAAELAEAGLVIKSSSGDVTLRKPPTVLAGQLHTSFDLVLLSCKAYDLADAIESFAPAIGPGTAILPLLNGMRHLDLLDQRFGAERVLGGQCVIAATLDDQRAVVRLGENHELTYGERDGSDSDRVRSIAGQMAGARFNARTTGQIVQQMWEKWVFIASAAGSTCLMRAAVGDIAKAPGGRAIVLGLLEECGNIARANGHPPGDAAVERSRAVLTAADSLLTASMLRDIERRAPIEADHIVGDLLTRAAPRPDPGPVSLLQVVYAHLKAYEARQQRTSAG